MKKIDRQKVLTTILSILLIAVSGLASSSGWAADTALNTPSATDKKKEKPKKPGFYTDSFRILPELQLTGYYDDNIYAEKGKEDRVDDYVYIISPTLKINSLWDRHSLKLNAGANRGRYWDVEDENYTDYWVEASGRYELGSATHLFGGVGYNEKHEGRDSKDSEQSQDEPTTYNVQSWQLGGRHKLADYTIRLGITQEKLDFDNIGDISDANYIDNADRDRTHTGVGLRVTRGLDKQTKVFAQGLFNDRSYEEDSTHSSGVKFPRSSKGYTSSVGMVKTFGKKDKIEAYLGLLRQEYDYARFDTVNELDYGFSLRWYPAETYKLTGSLSRTLSETTEEEASGYLYTKLNLQLDKRMFTDYVGYVSYGYGGFDYQEIGRDDTLHSFGIGLNYYMTPHLLFSGGYSYVTNDSSDPVNNYNRNLFLISVKAKLAP